MSKKPYRLLASLLLMLVATLTSCEKFSIDETTGKSREANANVTIHVQKIEGTSLLTTKAADKQTRAPTMDFKVVLPKSRVLTSAAKAPIVSFTLTHSVAA